MLIFRIIDYHCELLIKFQRIIANIYHFNFLYCKQILYEIIIEAYNYLSVISLVKCQFRFSNLSEFLNT